MESPWSRLDNILLRYLALSIFSVSNASMLSHTTISHSNFFHKEKKFLYHVLKIIKCHRNTCPNFVDGAVRVGNAEETENGEKEVILRSSSDTLSPTRSMPAAPRVVWKVLPLHYARRALWLV